MAEIDLEKGDCLLRCLLRDGDSSSYLDLLLGGFVGVKYDGVSSSESVSDVEYYHLISFRSCSASPDTHLGMSRLRTRARTM